MTEKSRDLKQGKGSAGSPPGLARNDRGSSFLRRGSKEKDRAKDPAGAIPPGDLSTAQVVSTLLKDLRSEREEVLEPLLHRLREIGEALNHGKEVSVPVLEEGLDLLETYLHRLHAVHVQGFARATPGVPHNDTCLLPLVALEGEPERAEHRLASIRGALVGYQAHWSGGATLLGLVITNECTAELSWEGYSEDFARTCLPSHLPPEALRAWEEAIARTRAEAAKTREAVARYVTRPFLETPASTSPASPRGPGSSP
jgi:hypothetical protein